MKSKAAIDVTVMLNVHREGRIVYPTLRSLARTITCAVNQGLSVEVVAILDRTDDTTRDYLTRYLRKLITNAPIVTKEVDYGDPGLARNAGVRTARGTVVGNLDGDDLFSENLIAACTTTVLDSKDDIVVHPEYIVSFGLHNETWHVASSTSRAFNKPAIAEYNLFPGPNFARKSLREAHPYKPVILKDGFGPEDWQWNVDTLSAGIPHVIGPDTAYYYRRKARGSMLALHSANNLLLAPSGVLSDKRLAASIIKRLPHEVEPSRVSDSPLPLRQKRTVAQTASIVPRYVLAKTGKVVGPAFRLHPRTRGFEHFMRLAFAELLATSLPENERAQPPSTQKAPTLPVWLIQEWKNQHQFEHLLFPDDGTLQNLHEYVPQATQYSLEYWQLLQQTYLDADYVFLIPWLRNGGADLVVLNYVNAILDISPRAKIVLIATEPQQSTLHTLLPASVKFITLAATFHELPLGQKTSLLATLLIQSRAKRVHVINSSLGFSLYEDYAHALAQKMRLYITIFSFDLLPSGKRVHRAFDGLPYFSEYITRVFADNQTIIDKFINWQGYPRSLFSVHYQPARVSGIKRLEDIKEAPHGAAVRALWAGRLDREKRPDTLIKIAEACHARNLPVSFDVYGSPLLGDGRLLDAIKACPYLAYKGPFSNGIGTLPLEKYDLFLLTSEYEGMPNVLLEAAAGGLPVMAPMVGGISELVTRQTGYPIATFDKVEEYVDALEWIAKNRFDLQKRLKHAREVVERRHSWPAFLATLQAEKGYL